MPMALGTVHSPTREYQVLRQLKSGETYDIFLGTYDHEGKERRIAIKAVGEAGLNSFAKHEAEMLTRLNRSLEKAKLGNRLLIPELVDCFEYHDGRQVIMTEYADGYYDLEEIREAYPRGVPPQHVAWMFRRMLAAIMAAHGAGIIHGKVLPHHVLIRSGNRSDDLRHTGVLVDWTCAVQDTTPGEWPRLTAMSEAYRVFYPQEVEMREPVTPSTDLAMAAACAQYLLGGDVASGEVPDTTPAGMARLFEQCRAPKVAQRPRDLGEFDQQFQRMLVPYFGPSKFVELPLPVRS